MGGVPARPPRTDAACSLLEFKPLPGPPCRNTAALEPVLWLTVGRLAEGGAVLQLQLSRLDQPRERDLVTGTWYPYIPGKAAWTLEKGQDSTST